MVKNGNTVPFLLYRRLSPVYFFLKINTFSEHIAAKLFFSERYAARSVLGLRGYGAYRGDIQRLWANLPKTGENLEMSFIRQGVSMSLGTSPADP